MQIERIEHVAVNVKNLDEAVKLFSDILGTTFVEVSDIVIEKTATQHASPFERGAKPGKGGNEKVAIDRRGFLALVESTPPVQKEGLRSIHFKVPDIEQAKAEMEQRGIRLTAQVKAGGMKEAVYNADDLHGVRLILNEYEAATLVEAYVAKE